MANPQTFQGTKGALNLLMTLFRERQYRTYRDSQSELSQSKERNGVYLKTRTGIDRFRV